MSSKTTLSENEITELFSQISLEKNTKFVVNSIMHANQEESDDSSFDSDESFEDSMFNFNIKNVEDYPYRTFYNSRKRSRKGENKIIYPIGILDSTEVELTELEQEKYKMIVSKTILPFLNKLKETGLKPDSTIPIQNIVSASFFLNKNLSLSLRKNNLLKKELASLKKISHNINYKIFAKYWRIKWYNKKNEEVKFDEVRKFYKQLKTKTFRINNEDIIKVPYQELRECLKNHKNTKNLIKIARESNNDVCLSFKDSDTVDFNGVYNTYLQKYMENEQPPTVMSTGYEYSMEKDDDFPYVESSKIDRQIRIAIAKYFPQGVYYSECNFCVLVPNKNETVLESFIDENQRGLEGNLESPILLKNLLEKRGETNWLFIDNNPLFTKIPNRVRKISFSEKFKNKMLLTLDDINKLKSVSQSTLGLINFLRGLNYNRSFKTIDLIKYNKCITEILNDNPNAINDLENLISCENNEFNKIKNGILAGKNIRNKYLKLVEKFSKEEIERDLNYSIIRILSATEFKYDTISRICSNVKIISKEEYVKKIIEILNENDPSEDILSEIEKAQNSYELSTIFEMYDKDPDHLKFMSTDDPDALVIDDSENEFALLKIGLEYDINIKYTSLQLRGDREDESTDYWVFQAKLECYNYYDADLIAYNGSLFII